MAEIIHSKKALAVNPLKVSQPIGASLAFLGLNRSLPLMHGSQDCTAFGKVFFVRHFREPIPLQTTAMDQVSSIMGADENIIEALRTLSDKSKPDIIGLVPPASPKRRAPTFAVPCAISAKRTPSLIMSPWCRSIRRITSAA